MSEKKTEKEYNWLQNRRYEKKKKKPRTDETRRKCRRSRNLANRGSPLFGLAPPQQLAVLAAVATLTRTAL